MRFTSRRGGGADIALQLSNHRLRFELVKSVTVVLNGGKAAAIKLGGLRLPAASRRVMSFLKL